MDIITETDIQEVTRLVIDNFLIPDFLDRGHNASGEWIDSVSGRAEKNRGIISAPRYTGSLIDGRSPNKDQDPESIRKWVMWYAPNIFEPWMQNKGINMNAYAVAYKIAREGTKIYREGGSDFLDVLKTEEVKNFMLDFLSKKAIANATIIIRNDLWRLKD